MLELEDRIRTEMNRQAEAYVPADDLPARIEARVRHRRVVRRSTVGVAAAVAVVVAVVAAGVLTRPADDSVVTDTPADTTPSTTDGSTTTSTTGTTTSTTDADATTSTPSTTADPGATTPVAPPPVDASDPDSPTGPPVAQGMPLHRQGVGRIVAGMTLRQAAEASGNTITPGEPIGPTSTCNTATIDGTGMGVMVSQSGDPAADPMDAVIQQVRGGRSTAEGVRLGDRADAVHAVYGNPTDVQSYYGDNYEVFEQGRFAYVVAIGPEGTVIELNSGFKTVYPEGCA